MTIKETTREGKEFLSPVIHLRKTSGGDRNGNAPRRRLGHSCDSYISFGTLQSSYEIQMGGTAIAFTATTTDSTLCPLYHY